MANSKFFVKFPLINVIKMKFDCEFCAECAKNIFLIVFSPNSVFCHTHIIWNGIIFQKIFLGKYYFTMQIFIVCKLWNHQLLLLSQVSSLKRGLVLSQSCSRFLHNDKRYAKNSDYLFVAQQNVERHLLENNIRYEQ